MALSITYCSESTYIFVVYVKTDLFVYNIVCSLLTSVNNEPVTFNVYCFIL